MKKLIFTSLALFMMLNTWAYDFKVDSVYYNITSSTLNTVSVISNTGYTGDIIIPSSVSYNGTTYSVTSISFFTGTSGLRSLSIPASVTSIGEYAFRDCDSLTTLTVDANNAYFSAQDGVLFNKVKTVLVHCLSAKSTYAIPSTVKVIATDAFDQRGLTSITIPASVDSIKEEALSGCSGLTSVLVPGSVKYIGYDAFAFCTGLKSVTLSNGLIMLDENAFYKCTSLTAINLPATLKTLGEDIFEDSGLITITVDSSNPYYSAKDGVLFNKDTTTLVCFPNGRTGVYTAPATVKTVKSHAFFNCSLTTVSLPSVTTIGDTVFVYSSNIASVTMPVVTSIGVSAFQGCPSLTSITIPSSITHIDEWAFLSCRSLKTIYALKPTALDISASNSVFGNIDSTCVLHVLVGSYTSYSTANQWKDLIIKADIVSGINNAQATKLKVTTENGNAVVTGLTEGTYVRVYNLQGTTVYSQKANAETLSIGLPVRGAYILNVDGQSVKFIY